MPSPAVIDRPETERRYRSGGSDATDVNRLRVMHVVYRLQDGGMERGVLKIVNGLRGSSIESSICSTVPAGDAKGLLAPGIRLFELHRRPGTDPSFVWELCRLLRRERPHILHTHSWGTLCEGLIARRIARVPIVIHGEHGTLQTKKHQLRIQRWAWQRADRLLAVSSRLADRMAAVVDIPRRNVRVIRNGVDTERFQVTRRAEARLRLGATPETTVIGTVGRLVDVKDHITLVDALHLLASQQRPFLGVIAGEGPLRPALQARIAALGLEHRVRLLGHRPDVEMVFAGLDLFVLPSRSEGLPNTILEALASGLPVIATRVGGADEIIEDGRSGILVEPRSPTALASAIAVLLSDRDYRAEIARAGRARAEREFSLGSMVAAYERLYLEVARERKLPVKASEPQPCVE